METCSKRPSKNTDQYKPLDSNTHYRSHSKQSQKEREHKQYQDDDSESAQVDYIKNRHLDEVMASSQNNLSSPTRSGSMLPKINKRVSESPHKVNPNYSEVTRPSITPLASQTSICSRVERCDDSQKLRDFYNDFTTIDWIKVYIQTNRFDYEVQHRQWVMGGDKDEFELVRIPLYYKVYFVLGKWMLLTLIGFTFAFLAFFIDRFELVLVGFRYGYCRANWLASQAECCASSNVEISGGRHARSIEGTGISAFLKEEKTCANWISWSSLLESKPHIRLDFFIYVVLTVFLALIACAITLTTKTTNPISQGPGKSDEGFPAEPGTGNEQLEFRHEKNAMYTASGSGVPEVKTILSGFVIRKFLGGYTLVTKLFALVFAIASGMSIGKEGPYVHLATAVGNVMARFFPFINRNGFLKKQILSASASSGVALAFGSPIGGVLFILEEISYSLPAHHLFQIFFCAMVSTLLLKLLDPYGTGNSILFELNYTSNWNMFELLFFVLIGISGGIFGAMFVKFVTWWPKNFRHLKFIKNNPMGEVSIIALLTGLVTFWNPHTKQASSELMLELASPCDYRIGEAPLCPLENKDYLKAIGTLFSATIIKIFLTFITFGLKIPSGIYVPSMVVGALYGRMFAIIVEYIRNNFLKIVDDNGLFDFLIQSTTISTPSDSNKPIDSGIYAIISAGAFMAGVTRMNITLVAILFELTSSYTYVLPVAIAISVANWMANLLESHSLYESMLITNNYPFLAPEVKPLSPFVTLRNVVDDFNALDSKADSSQSQEALKKQNVNIHNIDNVKLPFQKILWKSHSFSSVDKNSQKDKIYIDISVSPCVPFSEIQSKFSLLAGKTLFDGCIPLLKDEVCVGLLYFSELQYSIDRIKDFCSHSLLVNEVHCKLYHELSYKHGCNIEILKQINTSIISGIIKKHDNNFCINETDPLSNFLKNRKAEILSKTFWDITDLTEFIDLCPIYLNYNSEISLAHLIFEKLGSRAVILLRQGKYYGVLHKKEFIDYCRCNEG